jgi:hypothetical protein
MVFVHASKNACVKESPGRPIITFSFSDTVPDEVAEVIDCISEVTDFNSDVTDFNAEDTSEGVTTIFCIFSITT